MERITIRALLPDNEEVEFSAPGFLAALILDGLPVTPADAGRRVIQVTAVRHHSQYPPTVTCDAKVVAAENAMYRGQGQRTDELVALMKERFEPEAQPTREVEVPPPAPEPKPPASKKKAAKKKARRKP